jgi:hypothetical protein
VDQIDKLIAARARKIFEAEAGPNEVWGHFQDHGEQVFTFQERTTASDPTVLVVDAQTRQSCLDRARQQLKDEGAI